MIALLHCYYFVVDEGAGEAAGNLNIPHADVDPSGGKNIFIFL